MTAPSDVPEPELANSEPPVYYHKMDRRLIVLETRFEIILPTLATKADLAELRGEMNLKFAELRAELRASQEGMRIELQKSMEKMVRWMIALAASLFIGIAGMLITLFVLLRGLA